jgi:arylsulfatase A-like enzyme
VSSPAGKQSSHGAHTARNPWLPLGSPSVQRPAQSISQNAIHAVAPAAVRFQHRSCLTGVLKNGVLLLPRLSCLGLVLFSLAAGVFAATPSRPNILLVVSDDQGFGDFSLHGNEVLKTPNLDRFGREGIRFDRFFVSPVCSPTRASLLTGRWWLRSGVWGVTRKREYMRDGDLTIAAKLHAAGYRTGIFGKWHNGEQYPLTPLGRGFDEFLGFTAGHFNSYFDPELIRGTQPEKTTGYMTDILTDAAIDFMTRHRDGPFFCYVPYNAPHSPHQVPDRYFNHFKSQGLPDLLAAIYAMCTNLDENFGRLLGALDRLGLREDTLVIFLTDNGPTDVVRFNAGMRGMKQSPHEGGTRVPLFVQWPARWREPRLIPQIAAHIDVFPTLLELCGVAPKPGEPKLDGVSLVPLLDGSAASWPDRFLFTQQSGNVQPLPTLGAVRSQRFRAVREAEGGWQLYDMIADPGEKNDLASAQPSVLRPMAEAYDAWWRDVTSTGFAVAPLPIGYAEQNPVRLFAQQADLAGGVRTFVAGGYHHTWLTGWTGPGQKIAFPVQVARGGRFEVTLVYGCEPENAGATVRIASRMGAIEKAVPAGPAPRVPLPHRGPTNDIFINRAWSRFTVGTLALATGEDTVTLTSLRPDGAEVMDLQQVELRRVE